MRDKYPSFICPSCKTALKTAHDLNVLFHNSEANLTVFFNEVSPPEKPEKTDVELIFAGHKFDIKDVVIKEDLEEDKQNFDGFLNNLGTAVTAVFVNKTTTNFTTTEKSPVDLNLKSDLVCPHCDITCLTKIELVGHFKQAHYRLLKICKTCGLKKNENSRCRKCARRQYLCDICGHVSNTLSRAKVHRQTHAGKTFECHICHRKFSYQISLNLHVKSHANVRNHLCTLCGKTFFYSSALVYHMRMHTNERSFKCEYCDKTFYMKSALKRHTRIHTDDRPYVCGFCDKGFRSNGEKRKHEMIHTGEKPHKCRFCPKTFTSRYNQLVHHMAHSGPHECDHCSHSFIEIEFLRRHLKSKHNT